MSKLSPDFYAFLEKGLRRIDRREDTGTIYSQKLPGAMTLPETKLVVRYKSRLIDIQVFNSMPGSFFACPQPPILTAFSSLGGKSVSKSLRSMGGSISDYLSVTGPTRLSRRLSSGSSTGLATATSIERGNGTLSENIM